ncbi:adenylate/guanylate cyclase domain-containing protein [Parasedimentitalea psychrophila]|uniref:Adenylate/guanylate cyclase domain-containing protein n=1 Tax=Parasedimentitalea psychrophila TaxID=2997337 RepID=A0A9Y2KXR2_9RHOB|nr:adenylate/guanylate cyclase domain-containing protein [Parasedimentitalea psychrophila]WIY24473.1 adenylate/guanylate cyclase domain-containing protein [Parasedimentitalea psychrophila]
MSTKLESRRLAAIVAADMVGYSHLVEVDEAGTIARQKVINDDLIRPKVKEFGGRVVKTTGDGALIEFPSAINAVLCSVAVQREMADREVDIPEDRRIAYRVGINLGDIIHDGGDIFGDGVNVASRLEGLAEPGGIYISEAVFNNVKGKLDLGFADLGPQKVKNLSEPISTFKILLDPGDIGKIVNLGTPHSDLVRNVLAAFAIFVLIASGGYFAFDSAATRGSGPPRLLILPLKAEISSNKTFADAATENLITSFARLSRLTIVPRIVSMEYKGIEVTHKDLPEEFDIRYILDGTVRSKDGNVEIAARLRDTQDGSEEVIWKQTLSAPSEQFFDLLATLKQSAVGAMKIKLNNSERSAFNTQLTNNIEAYLAFVKAQRLLNGRNFSKVKPALLLYEKAMELDPGFVDAKIGYAELNYIIWERSWNTVKPVPEAFVDLENTIETILAADAQNARAIGLRIRLHIEHMNFEQALLEARAAIFLETDDPRLRNVLGLVLLASGDYSTAKEEFVAYEELSPRLNVGEKRDLAQQYLRLGNVKKALSLVAGIQMGEAKLSLQLLLAEAHARNGDVEIAKTYIDELLKEVPWLSVIWYKPLFDSYSDPSIYKAWAEAMIAAGLPETPYDFANSTDHGRLLHDDLIELFSDRYVETHDKDPFGAPYREVRRGDGSISMEFQWLNGQIITGIWYIKGDYLCTILSSQQMGREECSTVYIDAEQSTGEVKHVLKLHSFGLIKSEFRLVAE